MQSKEDIEGDFYTQRNENGTLDTVSLGMIARPSDQRLNVSIFFQDYIPRYETWQAYLSLHFGTGLPIEKAPDPAPRFNSYRRVDIGISKQLKGDHQKLSNNNPFKHFKNIWLSLEVFNLLDINNEISFTYVTDIRGWEYGVPNYLTGRRVNLKLLMRF